MHTSILIVDDHEVLREGVSSILKRARPEWEICGQAASGQEAIDAAVKLKPTIILLDITMPGMSGLEAASRISAMHLEVKILILTMHESGELANDARRVGANGYVTKTEAARQLVRAIEKILAGGTFFGGPEPGQTKQNPLDHIGPAVMLFRAYSFAY
jgi:DNA-binding NarL/FixJ family response regulator